jgi:hypothetical protein
VRFAGWVNRAGRVGMTVAAAALGVLVGGVGALSAGVNV